MPTKTAQKDSFLTDRSDDDLVDLARRSGNGSGAFEELYRRHENDARNVARYIVRSRHDADDVVNEAFAGVMAAINNGAGPRSNFRQYLMACVRNSCKSRRWCGRSISTDPSLLERSGPIFEDPERLSEAGLVANAFSSLSPDWQQTLWMTAVEERPTAEIAEQLGRRPAAVAALAHRAREAFAEAYLAQHQKRATDPACARISPKLAHYVRGRSGDVDSVLVERHLVACVACSCAVDEMRDLNASLRTLTGPGPLVGLGVAVTGAATIVEFMPLAAMGGWSVGGAAVAKVAVLAALLVPGAVVAARTASTPSPRQISTATPAGIRATLVPVPVPVLVPAAKASRVDTASVGIDPLLADVVTADPSVPAATSNDVLGAASDVVAVDHDLGTITNAVTDPSTSTVAVVSPVEPTLGISSLPAGGGTVNVGVGSGGSTVSVDVTIPLTLPINLDPTLLPLSIPSIALPTITIPSITIPSITTPPINTPAVIETLPDPGLPVTLPTILLFP